MSGWIKIHRSIKDHWLYQEDRVYSRFEAWNDILLSVNYSDSKQIIKGKVYIIRRGESIFSLDTWAKRWKWDKTKVRRFLNLLQNDSMIVLTSDNITTHLTVCNYASYQDERNASETQVKRKRNTNEIQTTPIKEEEERQEEKEKKDNRFKKPTIEEIGLYMEEQGMNNIAERFYNHYEAKGWMIGKNPVKNWKACVITWKDGNLKTTTTINRPKLATFTEEEKQLFKI
jgi:chitodextrinase